MRNSRHFRSSLLAAFALLFAGACGSSASNAGATAELEPLGDSGVKGKVTFVPTDKGVRVEARIDGLPAGEHGFHVHQYGDCSAPDGKSAGEHFNPDHSEHGAPTAPKRHAGDFGNVTTASDAKATTLDMTLEGFTLDNGPRGILGRSVVVHAAPDDLTSQPAGNSGARIACGIIRADRGETKLVTQSQ